MSRGSVDRVSPDANPPVPILLAPEVRQALHDACEVLRVRRDDLVNALLAKAFRKILPLPPTEPEVTAASG